MKRITTLRAAPEVVYADCVDGLSVAERTRWEAARVTVMEAAQEYRDRATNHELHLSTSSTHGRRHQPVLAGLTKDDFMGLYTNHMSKKDGAGRVHYNQILMSAPLGICPYCCFGHAATLDHFLGKARYPAFSILPDNLVPSCRDCNSGKSVSAVVENEQILHPYFEDPAVETDVWLFGHVEEGVTATVSFSVQPPPSWPADRARRLENFFSDFDLARRFGVQSGTELAVLALDLERLVTPELRVAYLLEAATLERQYQRNSWKSALYDATHRSGWYCNEGYRRP